MDFAQTFLLTFILILLISLVLTIVLSVRSKSSISFLLSFIVYWFLAFCLMILAQYWNAFRPVLSLPLSYIDQLELSYKVWEVSAWAFILVPLVFVIVSYFNPKRPDVPTVKGLGLPGIFVAFVILVFAVQSIDQSPRRTAEAEVKSNLRGIQIALERYCVENGNRYPAEINELITSEYITSFWKNPFSTEPMRPIEFGDPNFEGNFTYVPVIVSGEVTGYSLLGYGYRQTYGEDVNGDGVPDHVILSISSGVDTPENR